MRRLISNSSGFTLIELIIAFTVLAILSVVGVASFVDYSRSQAISADRQKIITVLNTAKANASSQLTDCAISYPVLNGYSVSIDTANKSYTLNIECITTGTPSQQLTSPLTNYSYNLSKNIAFDATTNVVKIFFPLFSGKAVLYSDTIGEGTVLPSGTQGTITLTGNDKTSTITIDQTGLIK